MGSQANKIWYMNTFFFNYFVNSNFILPLTNFKTKKHNTYTRTSMRLVIPKAVGGVMALSAAGTRRTFSGGPSPRFQTLLRGPNTRWPESTHIDHYFISFHLSLSFSHVVFQICISLKRIINLGWLVVPLH